MRWTFGTLILLPTNSSLSGRWKGAYITKKTRDQMMVRPGPVRKFMQAHGRKNDIPPTSTSWTAEMKISMPLKDMRIPCNAFVRIVPLDVLIFYIFHLPPALALLTFSIVHDHDHDHSKIIHSILAKVPTMCTCPIAFLLRWIQNMNHVLCS